MNALTILTCLICWLVAASTGARADTLRFVTLSYPPYEYEEADKVDGIVVRILREAFSRLGHELEIEVLPWKRALLMARQGSVDGIFTVYKTEERLKFLDYSETVVMPQVVSIWALKGSNVPFDGTMESLHDVPLGVVHGVSYGKIADTAIENGTLKQLDYAPNSAHNIKKLLAGRTLAVIMNRYGALYHLRLQNGFDKVEELQPEVSAVPSYVGFSKARNLSGLRDQFDQVLQAMITSGDYQDIVDGYYLDALPALDF
ncbi:substrate-binding periplasmic protein [Roseibium sediminicola]|uniref:Transporter substrate-binding domain-containing protein n=1 Tax=Roseibium sediminicola TaxID=2933272 RepID=A0ABT0GWE6_9HYPH|nr:transporter substrate-binding domain-containing protein [Roseibium sp. CAU 1639]MCK7613772.1 transporter substrate-binding domain-containing protein [Roseibium sp. CAU 1639]